MPALKSQLVGASGTTLVVLLPSEVADEAAESIREEVTRRLPNCDGAGAVLDLSGVELMNSIGITCLLQCQDHCRRRQAGFALACVPAPISAFLAQLKLDGRFARFDSVEEAVAFFDAV